MKYPLIMHPMKKLKTLLAICMATIIFNAPFFCRADDGSSHAQRAKQQTLEDWRQRRFGIFIHWGPASLLELYGGAWLRGTGCNPPYGNKTASEVPSVITSGEYLKFKGKYSVPQEVYDNLFLKFDPKGFNAREWAKLFKEAGAGYVIFTSKHHDGFCNFDTKTRSYNIMHSPFRRDICKELADACRAEGLMFIFYYSVADWWDPGFIRGGEDCPYVSSAFVPQINELLTNYGPVDGFWWDGPEKFGKKVDALIQSKQPWTIQNDRLGGGAPSNFSTPENRLGVFKMERPWESCITMTGEAWFWNGGKDYISATTCLRYLISCAVGDGNLALDIGPRGDGRTTGLGNKS